MDTRSRTVFTMPFWVWIVLNAVLLVVGAVLLILWTGTGASNTSAWLAGVGSGMIASAMTSTVLGTYELLRMGDDLQRQRNELEQSLSRHFTEMREHVAKQVQAVQALVKSEAAIEVISGPEDLYARATTLVQNATKEYVLSSDLRFTDREQHDQSLQEQYVSELCHHLVSNPLLKCRRAIAARTSSQCTVLKTINAPLLADGVKDQVEIKFYPRNPIAVDIVVGDTSALLAFQDLSGRYNTGFLISDTRAARKLREWFLTVIWDPKHLNFPTNYLRTRGETPFPIKSADEIEQICVGIKNDENQPRDHA